MEGVREKKKSTPLDNRSYIRIIRINTHKQTHTKQIKHIYTYMLPFPTHAFRHSGSVDGIQIISFGVQRVFLHPLCISVIWT